ncbi:MAG: UDP-N-acetylmuramoyl-L-alanyl-D-glutamate--2,6-diaminopimelate ligase [Gammaproteobacteria bacterium]
MMVDRAPGNDMTLQELLRGLTDEMPAVDVAVTGLSLDSRSVMPGDLFIALRGYRRDGREFIDEAVVRGARVILVESDSSRPVDETETLLISIRDLRAKTGLIASRFYGHPSRDMQVIGITGTNGKTSVCHFIAQVLSDIEPGSTGCIGTLGYGIYPDLTAAVHTTPDAVMLQSQMSEFRSNGARRTVMEVSSHALEQGRVNGTAFDIAVFTNISHEHMDYHGDMQSYAAAKERLFYSEGLKQAVINVDDDFGKQLYKELSGRMTVIGYALEKDTETVSVTKANVVASIIKHDADGLILNVRSPWGEGEFHSGLIGEFNACNLLAALSTLCLAGLSLDIALQRLAQVRAVPGRMEVFGNDKSPRIIVDYAHTPDALEQTLAQIRKLCPGKLVCVFGCGGDRDTAKRPLMGRVAEQYADRVIITSDNPRGEMPEKIIDEIAVGMAGRVETIINVDRTAAIRDAIESSIPGDVVLIAGKGHETWQEINGKRYPFSDRQLVRNLLEAGR